MKTTRSRDNREHSLVNAVLEVAGDVRLAAHSGEAQVDRPAPLGAHAMRRRLFRQLQLDAQLRAFAALLLREERRRRVRRVRRLRDGRWFRRGQSAQLEARRTRRPRGRGRRALARSGHWGGRLNVHSEVRHGPIGATSRRTDAPEVLDAQNCVRSRPYTPYILY